MVNIFAIYICIFSPFLCLCVWGQACNSAALRQYDSNNARLITVGNSGRKFPESKGSELKKYCDQSSDLITDIEDYKNRCMKGAAKQSGGVLIYAVKNAIKQMCKKDSKQLTKIIEATPCANQGNSEVAKCYAKLIDSYLGIQNEPDEKRKIPLLCCEYYKLFECVRSRLERISQCKEPNLTTLINFVKSMVGNLVDLACSDYTEGSDKCDKLGSPPKKKKNQKRSKSFVVPMIDILKSFPEV